MACQVAPVAEIYCNTESMPSFLQWTDCGLPTVYDYAKTRSIFRKTAKQNHIQAALHPGSLGDINRALKERASTDGSFHTCGRVARDLRHPIVAAYLRRVWEHRKV
jgi:hypothetical protein